MLVSTLCRKDGLVVAIVRGHSDEAAFSRLRAGYDSGDSELLKLFDDLASKHLKVYAGKAALTSHSFLKPIQGTDR